jgi:hypothetical protein
MCLRKRIALVARLRHHVFPRVRHLPAEETETTLIECFRSRDRDFHHYLLWRELDSVKEK